MTTKKSLATAMYNLGLLLLLNACNSSQAEDTPKAAAVPLIETAEVRKNELATELQLPGELLAYQQVDLYAKVSSFVKDLNVDIGSRVLQGQLLATLEAPELSLQLAAAHSRLKSQEAVYTSSKATYSRLLETSKVEGAVSQNDLDMAIARQNSDLAQLEAARAAYREVSVMKDYLAIRAPFSGIITARNANPGAYVGPSGKGSEFPLFVLQQQDKLRLAVSVPEAYTGYLNQNDPVSFRVRSIPAEVFNARIKRRAGALDTRLRAERVEMDVLNGANKLLPGTVAEVILPLPGDRSSLIVPKSAVVSSDEGVYLIKVVDRKALRVPVRKGRETSDNVEVFGEVRAGDVVVLKASEEIKPGTVLNTAK